MRFGFILLAVATGMSASASAANDAIIITGRGLAAPAGAVAYSSVVIDYARLTDEASGRLENILKDVAGFQQFRRTDSRSANPTSQGATLRSIGGNASSRALVLLDGVPQADPFAGFIAWSALAPAGLGAVRITRGGGGGPFGAGAVAGTIELFSGGPDELPGFAAQVDYGSRNALALVANASARLGSGFASVAANWDRGDGYRIIPNAQAGPVDIPARYDSKNIALRLVTATGNDSELQLSARGFDDRRLRGVAGTASTSRGADASVRLIGRGDWGYEALAYVQTRRFTSGFVAVNAGRTLATPSLDQFNTPATGLGAKLELRPPLGAAHTLQIGGDVRVASGATHERFRFQTSQFTRLRDAGGRTVNAGAYVEDSWALHERLLLTGGVRLDYWRISSGHLLESDLASGAPTLSQITPTRSGSEFTARGGALFTPTEGIALRATAYTAFRLPTLNELYRPFRVGADATAANGDLAPEKLRGAEIGVDWRPFSNGKLSLTAYHNRLGQAVTNVTQGSGPGVFPQVGFVGAGGVFRVRQNLTAIRVNGFEANGFIELDDWRLQASYAFADPKVEAGGLAAGLNGLRPAQSPQHQASATLGWHHAGLRANATLRYSSAQFDDDLNTRRLPPATTVDAALSVPLLAGVTATLRVENLFNVLVVSGLSGNGIIDRATPQTFWIGLNWARQ